MTVANTHSVSTRPHVRVRRAQRAAAAQTQQTTEQIVTTGAKLAAEAAAAVALTSYHLSPAEVEAWLADCYARLKVVGEQHEQNLGHIEEQLGLANQVQRLLAQRAAQIKANAVPCACPTCQRPLEQVKYLPRTFAMRFGSLRLFRKHGWCPHCERWHFPADIALGLGESTASPYLQEVTALLVSKMPVEQAHAVAGRLGLKLSASTMHREARAQGRRAEALAAERTAQRDTWEGLQQLAAHSSQGPPAQPFTLVVEIDAWNIRERDAWGQTKTLREQGLEPSRWHWVYLGTVFRLDHRGATAGSRAMITERGYVATRHGIETLLRQLYREAIARGLGQAQRVLVIADGAVWIWHAVADRFKGADQRLDLYHADEHLWAVAHELYGHTPEARQWVKPLLAQLHQDQSAQVIATLTELQPGLSETLRDKVQTQIEYFQSHAHRMEYRAILEARKACDASTATAEQCRLAQEPLGSGAIESTCRQYQCRFKRTGQFWTIEGDERLLALETLWRNNRWHLLFPHAQPASPMLN